MYIKQCIERLWNDWRYALGWFAISIFTLAILGSILFLTKTITEISGWFEDSGEFATNTITVNGRGEIIAIPDIATFSFTVNFTGESVESAQDESAKIINKAFEFLKSQNIDEKDIKTTGYNLNPRYEYIPCRGFNCGPSESKLIGYEVNQNVLVKVRKTEQAGEILSGIGRQGVTNISGLSFEIDDQNSLKDEARSVAIADARIKAEKLAKDLGVRIKKVVSFHENNDFGFPEAYAERAAFGGDSVTPELPRGENIILSTVSVTYEIR